MAEDASKEARCTPYSQVMALVSTHYPWQYGQRGAYSPKLTPQLLAVVYGLEVLEAPALWKWELMWAPSPVLNIPSKKRISH